VPDDLLAGGVEQRPADGDRVVGAPARDPAERALAAGHVLLVAAQEVEPVLGADLLLSGLLVDGLLRDLVGARVRWMLK
jgi:hypothetical protein